MFSVKDQASPHAPAAPSLIGRDVVITGILHSEGDIQIDGRVDGHVRGAAIVIGEEAAIQGEIVGESVTVRGRVDGTIRARKVALAAGCHVMGDIQHQTLEVEFGAVLEGHVGPVADPLVQAEPAEAQDGESDRRRPGSPMRGAEPADDMREAPQKVAAA